MVLYVIVKMRDTSTPKNTAITHPPDGFVRLGGFAILIGLTIHIVANVVLKTFPSDGFTTEQIRAYLTEEANSWAIIHGIRYIAIVCIVIFSAGIFIKLKEKASPTAIGWGIVGLLGTVLMTTNLLITNGIEILTFGNFNNLSEQSNLFWLLFKLTRVLFSAEIISWAILIFGFSVAGQLTSAMPKWIIVLGWLTSVLCLISAVFITSVIVDGWATFLIDVASMCGLIWFVCVGGHMLMHPST